MSSCSRGDRRLCRLGEGSRPASRVPSAKRIGRGHRRAGPSSRCRSSTRQPVSRIPSVRRAHRRVLRPGEDDCEPGRRGRRLTIRRRGRPVGLGEVSGRPSRTRAHAWPAGRWVATIPSPALIRSTRWTTVAPPRPRVGSLSAGGAPRGRARAVAAKRVLPDDDTDLVLIVDQFEELFTLASAEEMVAFSDALVAAATTARGANGRPRCFAANPSSKGFEPPAQRRVQRLSRCQLRPGRESPTCSPATRKLMFLVVDPSLPASQGSLSLRRSRIRLQPNVRASTGLSGCLW